MQFARKHAATPLPELLLIRRSEAALLERQRAFRHAPAWWRTAGTWVRWCFPKPMLKIFLTASAETRAQRRYKQLMEKGIDANIATLLQDIRERDARDSNRSVAPLQMGAGTRLLDTTSLDIQQAVDSVLKRYADICAKAPPSDSKFQQALDSCNCRRTMAIHLK